VSWSEPEIGGNGAASRLPQMFEHLARMAQLSQAAEFLGGKDWQRAQELLQELDQAQLQQPTRSLLLVRSTPELEHALQSMYGSDLVWIAAFRGWVIENKREDEVIPPLVELDWRTDMIKAHDARAQVQRALEDYVYADPEQA
jgi:hypothetical protein